MPIKNVKSNLRVKLLSFSMFYCLLVQTCIIILMLTIIYYFFVATKFEYNSILPIVFFLNSILIAITSIYISYKLPQLLDSWKQTELFDGPHGSKFGFRSKRLLAIFMIFAFFEHFVSKVLDFKSSSVCFDHYATKFEAFTRHIIPAFFRVFPYTHLSGVYVLLTCFYSTVLWNFSDVFLITISCIVYSKLRKFNRKIKAMKSHYDDKNFWRQSRLNFMAIHEQVKSTNYITSFLVMLSLLNDFYFICNQVLGAFK